jgi:hypothetical protein
VIRRAGVKLQTFFTAIPRKMSLKLLRVFFCDGLVKMVGDLTYFYGTAKILMLAVLLSGSLKSSCTI